MGTEEFSDDAGIEELKVHATDHVNGIKKKKKKKTRSVPSEQGCSEAGVELQGKPLRVEGGGTQPAAGKECVVEQDSTSKKKKKKKKNVDQPLSDCDGYQEGLSALEGCSEGDSNATRPENRTEKTKKTKKRDGDKQEDLSDQQQTRDHPEKKKKKKKKTEIEKSEGVNNASGVSCEVADEEENQSHDDCKGSSNEGSSMEPTVPEPRAANKPSKKKAKNMSHPESDKGPASADPPAADQPSKKEPKKRRQALIDDEEPASEASAAADQPSKKETKKRSQALIDDKEPASEASAAADQPSKKETKKRSQALIGDETEEERADAKGGVTDAVDSQTVTPTQDPPGKRSRHAPKKQCTFLTHQAAMGIKTACQLSSSEFHDFVCARSFDIISGGMYRKFLVQSRAAKEEWAFGVQSSISKLQKQVKALSAIVHSVAVAENDNKSWGEGMFGQQGNAGHYSEDACEGACERECGGDAKTDPSGCVEGITLLLMHRQGKKPLSKVLTEAMNSSSPPCKKRVDAVKALASKHQPDGFKDVPIFCAITGLQLEDMCIEIRPAGRCTPSSSSSSGNNGLQQTRVQHNPAAYTGALVVHPEFEHFFNMFWFCCKIEHIVRHMGKCWMEDNSAEIAEKNHGTTPGQDTRLGAFNGVDCGSPAASDAGDDDREGAGHATDMQSMCEKFSSEEEECIKDMHALSLHAFAHVVESIYSYPPMKKKNDEICLLALRQKQQGGTGASLQQGRSDSISRKRKNHSNKDENENDGKAAGEGGLPVDAQKKDFSSKEGKKQGDSSSRNMGNCEEDIGQKKPGKSPAKRQKGSGGFDDAAGASRKKIKAASLCVKESCEDSDDAAGASRKKIKAASLCVKGGGKMQGQKPPDKKTASLLTKKLSDCSEGCKTAHANKLAMTSSCEDSDTEDGSCEDEDEAEDEEQDEM